MQIVISSHNKMALHFAVTVLVTLSVPAATREAPMNPDQPQERATRTTIDRFNEAFNRHDADALAACLTDDTLFDDTLFEDTSPAPDGRRVEGKAAVVEFPPNDSV